MFSINLSDQLTFCLVFINYIQESLTCVSRGNFFWGAPAIPIMCGPAGSTGIVISARQSLIIWTYWEHLLFETVGKLHGAVVVVVVTASWTSFVVQLFIVWNNSRYLRYLKLSTFLEKIVCLPIFFNLWLISDKITSITFNVKPSTDLVQHAVMTTNYISPTNISNNYCLLKRKMSMISWARFHETEFNLWVSSVLVSSSCDEGGIDVRN